MLQQALFGKWLWRFGPERDVLWRRVIEVKYGCDCFLGGGGVGGSGKCGRSDAIWRFGLLYQVTSSLR